MFFARTALRTRRRLIAAIIGALVVGAVRLVAQSPEIRLNQAYVHESWGSKDGLPVNAVNAIVQDPTGYIWAATLDGLARFDGIRFTVFNTANSPGLPSNRLVQLVPGRKGNLWLVTAQGHVVRFADGKFTNIAFQGAGPEVAISNLLVDSASGVWFGNERGLWRSQGDTLVRFKADVVADPVTAITRRRDGSLWVSTKHTGLFRVGRDGSATKVPVSLDAVPDNASRMFEDSRGTMWLATTKGLWSFTDRLTETRVSGRPLIVAAITEVPESRAVYAQTPAGAYRVDGGTPTLVGHSAPYNPYSLAVWADSQSLWTVEGHDLYRGTARVFTIPNSPTVTVAVFDREGSLWLGTDGGGLHLLKPALFTMYPSVPAPDPANVYLTYTDRAGAVWFSESPKPGVKRIDPTTGRIDSFALGTDASISAMTEDSGGRIWVGGANGVYSCARPALQCRPEGPAELHDAIVFGLYKDAHSNIWVGAASRIYRFNGEWTSFDASSGAPQATARAFAESKDGAIWIGTNEGVARYAGGRFTRVTSADGLPSDLIRSLYADADGWVWVGTEGRGLARLDTREFDDGAQSKTKSVVRIGIDDGLFDETIHRILEDDTGRLWMNTNRGVFWVPRRELIAFADKKIARVHSTAYSERDGLRNREGNGGVFPDGAKGLDGRMWFPTQDGVASVNPADVGVKRRPPAVVVEGIVADGRTIPSPKDSALSLQPDQRDAQIQFTALTFLEPANVRFRYQLVDYDRGWVDAGSRRSAFYTKLPPGKYTFRVEASEAGGDWSEPGATMSINVTPQFWETVAFRWLSIAALAFAAVAGLRFRDRYLRDRALELEAVVAERTAALRERERQLADQNLKLQSVDEAKTRFFANVSHELRTPLTLTIGPLEDVRARPSGDPTVDRWLDTALRNSRRLLRLVNQLLDVAKLDAGAMRLELRPIDLAPFTRGIASAFTAVAEQKGVRLTTSVPESMPGSFDADAIEKILTNLLSNAIKFTPSGGRVSVTLTQENSSARWRVHDSGPGIPPDAIGHVFERFYRVDETANRAQPGTGIGLSLVKELAELHGGRVDVESDGQGTTFTATIPLGVIDATAASGGELPQLAAEFVVTNEHGMDPDAAAGDSDDDVPTLLVVDDSADLRAYIRDHFASRFRVLEAQDGAMGLDIARRSLPDVIVSDVMMPGTDGNELVRALRESPETDFLGIILLTAQAGDQQRIAGLERGADDYMVKPFEMRELDVRVRNLIASRRRLRERFSAVPIASPSVPEPAIAASAVPSDEDAAYVSRVRDVLRKRLSDPEFGVAEFADALAQDRTHLFRRVKQTFGESPSDLLRRSRLEESARLLRAESSTVTAIAYAVGFNSVSHFCRRFLEAYGMTPAAYRQRGKD